MATGLTDALFVYLPLLYYTVLGTTQITYTGTTTTLLCVNQTDFETAAWGGPPPIPGVTPYWYYPDQFNPNLSQDIRARISFSSSQSLIMTGTKLTDSGKYECSKYKDPVTRTQKWDLVVRRLSMEPEITTTVSVDSNRVLATEGQSLTVTCTSRGGNPAPTVVWYKGSITGQELDRTSTGTPAGDNTFTVTMPYTFSPSKQDDRQQLVCRSYYPTPADAQGSQIKAVTLYLYLKPSYLTISLPVSVVTGNNITATCTTTGSRPAADMSWTYRGQTSTPTGTATEDTSSQTFTVEKEFQRTVTAADNGQTLQCTVNNIALTSPLTGSKTLDVQFPVDRSSTSITGNNQIEANGVNPLHLTCKTGSSNPASDITWRKGSDIISSTNAYTDIAGANNGHVRSQVLTLQPSRNDDGDTITCLVSNVLPQSSDLTTVDLNLKYSPIIADMADMSVTEGDQAILKCNANSKPVASFTWKKGSAIVAQGTGTTSYNGHDYTIPTVSRTQAGTYTCIADNQLSLTDSKLTTLRVLYPPNIDVVAVNTTVNSQSTTVTCDATGVPDQYTYQRWVHTWNGRTVTHLVPLPNTKELTLTDLSYAHSGVYTCRASNGVKGVSHGSGALHVKSFPVLVGVAAETKEVKTSGQLHKPITAKFQYFSNAGKGSVKVYWTNGTTEEVGTVTYRDVDVQLPVFGSTITTPGTEAIINITVKEESRFGRYEVRVTNEVNRVPLVTLALVIQPLGTPEPPSDIIIVLIRQSVEVTWKSGSPNGLSQTFVIQLSTDNSTWRDISLYGGLSYQQTHHQRVDDLSAGQLYYMRMVSANDLGTSTPTRIVTFTTESIETTDPGTPSESVSGWILGGVASGLFVIVIVVLVSLFIIWRRKGLSLLGNRNNTGTVNERDKWSHTEGTRKRESTDDAAIATGEGSDTALQYETLHDTGDKRLYEQLKANEAHENPLTNDSIGLSTYESLQRGQDNEQRTYEQLQSRGSLPTVYENLKVKTTM